MGMLYNFKSDLPIVVAHRGYSAVAPENTISAFRYAIRAKADMIELDIRLTKDGTAVVIHDSKIDRTTNGSGRVRNFYLWHLKEFDAGAWFNIKFKGEKIPTLDEVLRFVNGRIPINIEIKKSKAREKIEERVIASVYEAGLIDKVLISSFNPQVIKQVRRLSPEVRTGFLYHYPVYFNPVRMLERLKADIFIHNYKFTNEKLVRKLHNFGYKIFVYTVNKPDDIKRMIEIGVDGVITDEVKLVKKILSKF